MRSLLLLLLCGGMLRARGAQMEGGYEGLSNEYTPKYSIPLLVSVFACCQENMVKNNMVRRFCT